METETPSASWHPALMPNSIVEASALSRSHVDKSPGPEPSVEADGPQPEEYTDSSNHEIQQNATNPAEATNVSGFQNQFNDGDDDPEAGLWAYEAANDSTAHGDEGTIESEATEPQTTGTSKAPKHRSTMSFARTVSHEVNWTDDEDADWNLQRTETDPFRFMPPTERTNSFPVVPPAKPVEGELIEQPPAPTQAQEILQELERDEEHGDLVAHVFDDDDAVERGQQADSAVQQYVGRDMVGTEEDASDTRFQEGLPLIPQYESEEPVEFPPSNVSESADPFGNETVKGGDDFFSQTNGGSNHETVECDLSHSLQRKNTSMFVGTDSEHPTKPTAFEPENAAISELTAAEEGAPVTDTANETADGNSTSWPESGLDAEQGETIDLDAQWAAALADVEDDELLLEDSTLEPKEIDPADFFGSDDEGFLEDTAGDELPQSSATQQYAGSVAPEMTTSSTNNRYTPNTTQTQAPPAFNTYNSLPSIPQLQQTQDLLYDPSGTVPPNKPEIPKFKSFADKAKGGYSSPYDLPMDVVKQPKKRISMQQLPRANSMPLAPPMASPRSTSMYSQPVAPPGASTSRASLPAAVHPTQQALPGLKALPQLKAKSSSFFEDLPIHTKPRPGSRQGSLPSPRPYPLGHPQATPSASPPMSSPMASPALQLGPLAASLPGVSPLVAPQRVSPYAQLQPDPQPKTSAPPSNRYSPAPTQVPTANGAPPTSGFSSRYSPAPANTRPGSGGYTSAPPPVLAHLPRTSSPLAHFEASHERPFHKLPSPSAEGFQPSRSGSSQYEPRINRLSSLPPTQEVEEEAAPLRSPPVAMPPVDSNYSPRQTRHTPPPTGPPMSSMLSPPNRPTSSYVPLPQSTAPARETNFVPPPRSQTQSPGALYGNRSMPKTVDPVPRPSSVHGATSPRSVSHGPLSPAKTRTRGMSQALNLVAPTDGREKDPLQRWRGAPLITWAGNTIVTTFPKDVPRYGMSQVLPMILRSPGEVKMKHVKDVLPLEERLAKFPGPLKGKSKKKDTIAWLTAGIEGMENALPNGAFQHFLSLENKRAVERVLLWKILRVFVEFDGILEGNPAVEKAVRQVLSPEIVDNDMNLASTTATGVGLPGASSTFTGMQADAVDSSAVEQIRNHLLLGDREKAVWIAVDKRLWGHAMLISSTVSGDLYKQVAQEFVKKEVNQPGHGNESLAALYGVLSGNYEESVDELVPSHARAGLQLMSTSTAAGQSKDALAGLDRWQETLGLILSNRSNGDVSALTSLGNLLSGYGRAEAAHTCFLFARQHAVFGGLDDPNANFVLVGADHRRQAGQFAKETEALLLSEVYEYGLSLAGGSTFAQSCPHLAAYKLQHAITLAEHGFRDKALQYCEAIIAASTSQTKRSHYYNVVLESSVDDLLKRVKQAPREESSSWIPKPRMEQVSNTMWTRFNKFVAGDENEGSGAGSPGEPGTEAGPFSRIAGGTPTISRSPSLANFEPYGNNGPSPVIPATKAGSRYAPVAGQQPGSPYEPSSGFAPRSSLDLPRSSMERSSGEYHRSSYESQRPATETMSTYGGGSYSLESNSVPSYGYQPAPPAAPQGNPLGSAPIPIPSQSLGNTHSPYAPQTSFQPLNGEASELKLDALANGTTADVGYQPASNGYEPPTTNSFMPPSEQPAETYPAGGYEAPSYQPYGFEPPSYQPGPDDGDSESDKPKPKKKSFMDDDDDIPAMKKPQGEDKSKAEKDRENAELFRKVAEEDAKRAEAQKAQKKGWFGGGWFGGTAKKEPAEIPNKPVKANLGEASSFVYDPELKRWVNKKSGGDNTLTKTATPPPPRAASRNGTPPPPGTTSSAPPPSGGLGKPPPSSSPLLARATSNLVHATSSESLRVPSIGSMTPPMGRSVSNMSNVSNMSGSGGDAGGPPIAPPSRPATSLSNASSIDDLLGASGPRKAGARKGRKGGRYVDVMAK
ncbi:Sec23-binding domain of Sec16-domain-containing protein [Pseudomassariella vexata]|uniref:Protein transport protein sec16 n=1 Tax=Pseudomassariella vexata TaxID=1141098 RepID=A0A1Y2EI94_9PEZI|nr:Sec23-binding domain of Sec16-domain-containing protein [Pseudomassariella vexata]ORY71299.1 Sec23-binding domain of Sec16-domain-containing protein [Pseudomassariella vexata]